MKDDFDYLGHMFEDQEFLDILARVALKDDTPKTTYNLKDAKEKEIHDFIEKNGREPSLEAKDISEKLLAMRAKAIKERKAKEEQVAPKTVMETNEASKDEDWERILNMVDLGNTSIKDFSNSEIIRPKEQTERAEADFVSRAEPCPEFYKFKPLFDDMKKALYQGHRKMVPFTKQDVRQGCFYVRKGMFFYVDILYEQTKSKIREYDGRTHLIFDNGKESNILVSTLRKSMYEGAYTVTEDDRKATKDFALEGEKEAPKFNTGFIYILNTLSKEDEVKQFKDLHKIGFTRGSIEERIRNARNETTYLCADVAVADRWQCADLNPQKLEDLVHKFFASARVRIRVKDDRGHFSIADEWYDVPLVEIRKIVPLVLDETVGQYYYDPGVRKVMHR